MKSRAVLIALIPIFAVACAALAGPDQDDEVEVSIELKDAPKAVQAAILKVTKADAITEMEKVTYEGNSVYDVEYKRGEKTGSMSIAASGEVIETETEVDVKELPEAVRAAIAKEFPGAKIVGADLVTYRAYTVVLKTKKDKHRGVVLIASGHIEDEDEEEEDGKDDDDDDDDDDEDDDDDDGDDDDEDDDFDDDDDDDE